MSNFHLNRRAVIEATLLGTAPLCALNSRAFAASCDDHIVRIGAITSPDTLNPFASWGNFWPLEFTYDWLVCQDAQRHADRKGFAESWSVADDQLTWTFKIWPGMKWSDGRPATAKDAAFTYNFFNTADPIAQGLKSGGLDYGLNLTSSQWPDLSKDPNIVTGKSRIEQRNYLAFNTASGEGAGSTKALQDPAFRDAIGYAIDQKAIVERALHGHGDPGVGLVMPVAADYFSELSDIRRNFDLAEAGRRLDAAGYRDVNGDGVREDKEGKSFQLELITGSAAASVELPIASIQLIAGWLGEIGVPVSVTQLDTGAITARTAAPTKGGGGWGLFVSSNWLSPTPHDRLGSGSSKLVGTFNKSYWTNEKFHKLLYYSESVTACCRLSQVEYYHADDNCDSRRAPRPTTYVTDFLAALRVS